MNQEFDFFKTTMPKTRMADYYLGCLDSSVFLDFNKSKDNLISLVRISFDGYGCCELNNSAKELNLIESTEFIEEVEKKNISQEIITRLVKKIIAINENLIWSDAIKKYELI